MAGRTDAIVVWTGDALLVWGGVGADRMPLVDGALYDPVTGRWTKIAGAPHAIDGASAVWTGSDLIVWGAADPIAYSPTGDVWRTLPTPPIEPRRWPGATWTGSQAVFWGGHSDRTALVGMPDGATYDPSNATWSRMSESPFDADSAVYARDSIIWTGANVMVVARPARPASVVDLASYDPATNAWDEVAGPGVAAGDASHPYIVGSQLVVLSSLAPPQVLDLGTSTWRTLPDVPDRGGSLNAVPTSTELLLPARDLLVDPSTGVSSDLPRHPIQTDASWNPGGVWSGSQVFLFGGIDDRGDPSKALFALTWP